VSSGEPRNCHILRGDFNIDFSTEKSKPLIGFLKTALDLNNINNNYLCLVPDSSKYTITHNNIIYTSSLYVENNMLFITLKIWQHLKTMGRITTSLLKLPLNKIVIKVNIKRYGFMSL
jgi:hypothetical protein